MLSNDLINAATPRYRIATSPSTREHYRQRNQIEHVLSRIKQRRGLAKCYNRRSDDFAATLTLAATGFLINEL